MVNKPKTHLKTPGQSRKKDRDKAEKIQKALFEIADAASALTDMDAFYAALHRIVGELMYARNFYVTLYDPVTQIISAPYFADETGDSLPPPARLDPENRSLRGFVLRTGETLHVSAEEIEEGRQSGKFTPMGNPAEDWIGAPLKVEGRVIGLLTVQSYQQGLRYDEDDVQLLEFVAQHIAVALTRARAIDETRQRNAELQIINRVQEGLARRLDFEGVITLVGDTLHEIFDVSTVQISLYDPATNLLHTPYCVEDGDRHNHPARLPSHIRKHVIETKQTVVVNENVNQVSMFISQDASLPLRPRIGKIPRSVLFMPLLIHDQVWGIISLQENDRDHAFPESTVRLVSTLANSMSVALENARLWEQEKAYRKALERELEIGREIQAGFLPEALPDVPGWEFAAALLPAREVAGDFYDVFELSDGSIGLVIADVCDKGVGAALFMTLFRSLIRVTSRLEYFESHGQAYQPPSAAARLQRAITLTNNYIAETHGESGMYATLFFGILDPRDGRLTYVNGGHEPPLVVRGGKVSETLTKSGPAVGVFQGYAFDLQETQLNPGDILFGFTDGVPDAQNPRGEFFGRERLVGMLCSAGMPAQACVASIEAELREYIGSAIQYDDITVLVARRLNLVSSDICENN